MPLQNRSAPDGSLHTVPDRGLFMGNRGGRLHRPDGSLGAVRWRSRAWICCLTAFRGRHRQVWGDSYTEIFFLDEATALAAGHRPCFECRRTDARAFADAWARAAGTEPPPAPAMDRILHAERLGPPEATTFADLPPGAIFRNRAGFHLRTTAAALPWSFAGYGAPCRIPPATVVQAVTPCHSRSALAAGYRPQLHSSAGAQFSAR